MQFRIVYPSRFLKQYVKYYCIMESDDSEGNIRERVIPVENIQLMFHYREPFKTYLADGSMIRQPISLVGGLSNTYFDAETHGPAGVIFVSFYPVGACCFFSFPLCEFNNQNTDLSLIWSNDTRQVEQELQDAPDESHRIGIIERFLMNRFTPVENYDYRLVRHAVELIKNSRGQIPAHDLANRLSVTHKTLERKFMGYVGFTPKRFARLIRFQNLLLDIPRISSLTQCSAENGYFDQSHFIHDFKRFSGYTPGEYAGRFNGEEALNIEFTR